MTTLASHHPSLDDFFLRLKSLDTKLATPAGKRQLLPSWWDPSLLSSPNAVQQVVVGIARALNLELASVFDTSQALRLKGFNCQYKKSKNTRDDQLAVATSIIHSAALTAIKAINVDFVPLATAVEIRQALLAEGHACIDFNGLVGFCWAHGIPVLHIPKLPVSRKMDAVVVDIGGRPAIALTKNFDQSSWLLFHLAHELGHIASGHLQPGETLIDEKINQTEDGNDRQEREADEFALALLTGNAQRCYYLQGQMTHAELVMAAISIGIEQQVWPGHVVLNWAFQMAKADPMNHNNAIWALAGKALKEFDNRPNWQAQLHQQIEKNLDEDRVAQSDIDYLYKLIGLDS